MIVHLGIPLLLLLVAINFVGTSHPETVGGGEASDNAAAGIWKRSIDAGSKVAGNRVGGKTTVASGRANVAVFSTENSTAVLAQIGGTAFLPCVVRKYNEGVVSWLREWPSSPPTLLTFGVSRHTVDDRYYVEHIRHTHNWGLVIKPVHPADEGIYKCQVSTYPPTTIFIQLKVTEAYAEILGAPDLHLRAGSTLRLVCSIKQSTEPPAYVFWYHESRMINSDAGVQVFTHSAQASVLHVDDADKSHAGNYTCKPSNALPASINVHVLNDTEEENPAAMLHANATSDQINTISYMIIALLVQFITLTLRFKHNLITHQIS